MKKIMIVLLVILLSLGAVACDGKEPEKTVPTPVATTTTTTGETPATTTTTTTAKPQEPTAPDGYRMYEGAGFGFAYPSEWSRQSSGNIVQLINSTGVGNNITVSYEAYSDIYKTMTVTEFNTLLKPALQQAGMQISNVSVEQGESDFGVPLTKIVYSATMQSVAMKQTILVFAKGDRNYCITVTEQSSHAALVENVLATLHLTKG